GHGSSVVSGSPSLQQVSFGVDDSPGGRAARNSSGSSLASHPPPCGSSHSGPHTGTLGLQQSTQTNSTLDNKRAQAVGGTSGFVRSVPARCVLKPEELATLVRFRQELYDSWACVRIVCSSCWMPL